MWIHICCLCAKDNQLSHRWCICCVGQVRRGLKQDPGLYTREEHEGSDHAQNWGEIFLARKHHRPDCHGGRPSARGEFAAQCFRLVGELVYWGLYMLAWWTKHLWSMWTQSFPVQSHQDYDIYDPCGHNHSLFSLTRIMTFMIHVDTIIPCSISLGLWHLWFMWTQSYFVQSC